jgi:DhnA family fructose-bisphosphate aldolase class Ia
MSGKELRLKKLFGGKKNLVISALDHVMEYGDQPGIEDAEKAIKSCLTTDALLMPRFMLKRNAELFAADNAPTPVVRINWTSAFYYPLDYRKGYTIIASSIEEAVEAGAEVAICSLFLENEDEEMETKNIEIFSEVVRQKEKLGIPLIGECYVVEHMDLTPEQDLIKAFYTENYNEIADNTPAPIFVIGAEKLDTDLAVLKKAENSVKGGARGIIFGRNIFMAENPEKLVKALNEVMNDGAFPEAAAKKYGLK